MRSTFQNQEKGMGDGNTRGKYNRWTLTHKTPGSNRNRASEQDNEETVKRERRRARFATENLKIESQKSKEFGLLSRGQDNRLQKDSNARKTFLSETQQLIDEYKNNSPSLKRRDKILMNFRKLRESVLQVESDKFVKSLLLASMRFSILVGHYQSYIPSIEKLLERENIDDTFLTPNELQQVWCYFVLHIVHFSKEYERGFSLFFENMIYHQKEHLQMHHHDAIEKMTNAQLTYELITAFIEPNRTRWIQIYNYLGMKTNDEVKQNIRSILRTTALHDVLQDMAKALQSSYFVLDYSFLRALVGMDASELVSITKVNWVLDDNAHTVTLRARSQKQQPAKNYQQESSTSSNHLSPVI